VVDAIERRGLLIHDGDLSETFHPAVATSVASLPPSDLVLLTVRTYDVEGSVPDVRKLMGERGLLVAFQNGVGTEEALAQAFGRSRVIAGTLTVSETMEEPGVVTRLSKSGGIALATMDGSPVPAWLEAAFAQTGLPTVTIADYRSLRWSKLLLNMLAAPISAILDIDIDELMANPALFRLEQLTFREASRVMAAMDVEPVDLPGYQVRAARRVMGLPRPIAQIALGKRIARARSGRSPGMRADMARGKSEVGDFNGAIARAGKEVNVPTPVNDALTALTEELAAHAETRTQYRDRPEALLQFMRRRGVDRT
jgi:2-dehydropantoate 2-reductase